ncbi:MAG: hypothetical protein M3439_12480 [Chloroflexota bacterium]|nr:hypothetical protein [Chloroflexota bacterium]
MPKQKPRLNQPGYRRAKNGERLDPRLRPRKEIIAQRKQRERTSEGPSLEALAGAVIAGPIGYLAVEGIMNDGRHPIHYVVTAVFGIIGYMIGAGVYRWRESHL